MYIMGTSLTLRLFFHKVSVFNTLFPPLHEMLYASHIKLFAEALDLPPPQACACTRTHTHFLSLSLSLLLSLSLRFTLSSANRHPQTASFKGAQKDGSQRVLNRDCR